jgi:hypothetical protein
MSEHWERLKLDYEQALQTYRQLADIRFKLLAFVPTISGAAIALLTQTKMERWEKVVLAGVGFLVTLGVVLYDQRNTQFHNGAIGRARHLEEELGFVAFEKDKHVGLFGSRWDHQRQYLFGLPVGHDLGLALIYSPVLGAWLYAVVRSGWPAQKAVAVIAGVAVAGLALVQFEWHNGKPKRLKKAWKMRQEAEHMQRDKDALRELNVKIGIAESEGDREFLSSVLAPVLAFRRASGAVVDRATFLDAVKQGARRETAIESIDLLGSDRAVVTCMVSLVEGDRTKQFHNVRLFVRSSEDAWKLLGWANEPV